MTSSWKIYSIGEYLFYFETVMFYFYEIFIRTYSIPNHEHADVEARIFCLKINVQATIKVWHPHEKYRLMVSVSCNVDMVMIYFYKIFIHTYSIPNDEHADI